MICLIKTISLICGWESREVESQQESPPSPVDVRTQEVYDRVQRED